MPNRPTPHGPKDYLDLARDPTATVDELRALASSPYDFVRLAVAEHPNTPADVLETLVPTVLEGWNGDVLMCALAANPSTPAMALCRLPSLLLPVLHERDRPDGFRAGVELARRADVPLEALLAMLDDPRATTEFRKVIARETTRPELLDHLAQDRSERVRRMVQRRRASP